MFMQDFIPTVKMCQIFYWQNMNKHILFKFDENTVTIHDLLLSISNKVCDTYALIRMTKKVYYLQSDDLWERRIKIESNDSLRNYLLVVYADESRESRIVVSFENDSPTKAPTIEDASIASTVSTLSSGSGSRKSYTKNDFRERVLLRDKYCCVFCESIKLSDLQAAHVYDMFSYRVAESSADLSRKVLEEYDIAGLNETSNGITLCRDCHLTFDAQKCCIKVEEVRGKGREGKGEDVAVHKIEAAYYLKTERNNTAFVSKWTSLHGKKVKVPTNLKLWPNVNLLRFREAKYIQKIFERNQVAEELKFFCHCGKGTKTENGLKSHQRSMGCLLQPSTSALASSEDEINLNNEDHHDDDDDDIDEKEVSMSMGANTHQNQINISSDSKIVKNKRRRKRNPKGKNK